MSVIIRGKDAIRDDNRQAVRAGDSLFGDPLLEYVRKQLDLSPLSSTTQVLAALGVVDKRVAI